MLKITLMNGREVLWDALDFDDYKYDGKMFIIIKDGEWIAFYNIDCIVSIVWTDEI